MRCPTLAELPPPPPGKTGWPWTVESAQLPDTMPDGRPWPRISIVTPSCNQGEFIEETIRSVLLQGYPDLEYFIMDGGSVDQSVEIIKKYSGWLSSWRSQPDGGQVEAINSGLSCASGIWLNWLNSDDFLHKGALSVVANAARIVSQSDMICGCRNECDVESNAFYHENAWIRNWQYYLFGIPDFPQDATFFSRDAWRRAGPLDTRFNYGFDTAFYYRLLTIRPTMTLLGATLSSIRVHGRMKTKLNDPRKLKEHELLLSEYYPTSLFSRLIHRSIYSRLKPLAAAVLRTIYSKTNKIYVVLYDPITKSYFSVGVF